MGDIIIFLREIHGGIDQYDRHDEPGTRPNDSKPCVARARACRGREMHGSKLAKPSVGFCNDFVACRSMEAGGLPRTTVHGEEPVQHSTPLH